MRELSIEDIANEVATKESIAEATKPNTLPTGGYRLRYVSHQFLEGEREPVYPYVRFTAAALDPTTQDRKGSVYFNATARDLRFENGKQLGDAKRFGQMVAALDCPPTLLGITNAFRDADVYARVTETLVGPEGGYLSVGGDRGVQPAELGAKLAEGYKLANFVVNISRVKA